MGILHFGSEGIKIHIKKNLPTFSKISIQNNPLMELQLILYSEFQNHKLSGFSAINNTVTGVKGGRGLVHFVLINFFGLYT